MILIGANYMTDGAAALAARLNVSEFIIGLTIVAIGTSAPEMVVSIISAMNGSGDIAVGNVVGSNIFNTLLILGICAVVRPVALTQRNIFRDIPLGIVASLVLLLVSFGGEITRWFGLLLLVLYIGVIIYSIRSSRPSIEEVEAAESTPKMALWLALVMVVGGLATLIYGGDLLLENAISIAHRYSIPDNVIAITMLAGGTSMPELAASLVSLIKGKSDIALGNVIGSNIANILLVLGASASISPLTLGAVTNIDMGVVLLSSVLLFLAAFTFQRREIDRIEGVLFLAIFFGYIYYLVG